MKRIAIFCDGTWQSADQEHPSNVARLKDALAPTAEDDAPQRGIYVPGVGAAEGGGLWRRLTGGAFGVGLDANIEAAYRALMAAYEPGDEVFVFGFSRGAYTARSLVGLIRRAGLMAPVHAGRVGDAMALYRRRVEDGGVDERGRKRSVPDRPEFLAWRAAHSPLTATSAYEIAWRQENGHRVPERVVELAFLGVWDTVGALGVPGHLTTAPLFNRGHEFHDTALSSLVRRARHAVAVDERRLSFAPTLWTNLRELNLKGLGLPATGDLSAVPAESLPYRQEWFPGDHGAVGGGHPRRGLSSYALAWVAAGAEAAGLAFDPAFGPEVARTRDARDELLTRRPSGPIPWRLRDRDGPEELGHVSEAVRERVRLVADYAPQALARVLAALRPSGP